MKMKCNLYATRQQVSGTPLVGNDHKTAQSERNSHFKNLGGKKLN